MCEDRVQEEPASGHELDCILGRIARGQTKRLNSGVASPLQGAEVQNPLFSPLKRGRDPGSKTTPLAIWARNAEKYSRANGPGQSRLTLGPRSVDGWQRACSSQEQHDRVMQWYLAHKKQPPPLEPL